MARTLQYMFRSLLCEQFSHKSCLVQKASTWGNSKSIGLYEKIHRKYLQPFKKFHSKNRKETNMNLVPDNGVSTGIHSSNLVKPFCFTVVFCGSAFGACSIWQYENLRGRFISQGEAYTWKQGEWRRHFNIYWNNLSEGEKIFWPICFLNALVFLAWKVPHLQTFMLRQFAANPAAKNVCLPMVLSMFSHYSALHLGFNMFALHSFSTATCQHLGKEQFLALYLSGGVIGNFFSHSVKVLRKMPGSSLGASGAILGIVGYLCCTMPDARLTLIFLPMVSFSAKHAIMGIMAFDTAGLILRKSFLDHAAHLGGTLTGVLYSYYGYDFIWRNRESVVKTWHKIRGKMN